jgi:hypothetical protein
MPKGSVADAGCWLDANVNWQNLAALIAFEVFMPTK